MAFDLTFFTYIEYTLDAGKKEKAQLKIIKGARKIEKGAVLPRSEPAHLAVRIPILEGIRQMGV